MLDARKLSHASHFYPMGVPCPVFTQYMSRFFPSPGVNAGHTLEANFSVAKGHSSKLLYSTERQDIKRKQIPRMVDVALPM